MVGTVTHSLAQKLNGIIRDYLNETYIIKSSNELILQFHNLNVKDIDEFCSLDVESLFTNVPVRETMDIIIDNVYNHPQKPPPTLPPIIMRDLLLACTT